MITEITKENFEKEVTGAEKPVVADFWAPWCGHCRRFAPALERLEAQYGDKVRFVKVNVDDNGALAEKYGVSSIPTLLLFENGKVKTDVVGPESQSAAEKWLSDNGVL